MSRRTHAQTVLAAAALAAALPLSRAAAQVDGVLGSGEYNFTLAVQNTPTGFGDNQSELNAAFARVLSDGSVRLMLTGNLETNGNGIVIFMDTRAGGVIQSTLPGGYGVFGSVGGARIDDWGTDTDGEITVNPTPGGPSIVSPGFNPNIGLELNAGGGTGDYYINIIDMTVPNEPLPNRDVFLGQNLMGAPAVTQTYERQPNLDPFGTVTHAFDNSNVDGVIAFNFDEPPGALGEPLSATRGFEATFSSLFLNQDPLQPIRILPFITNGGGDFLSNQFLPGVGGQSNLGGPGEPGGTPLFDVRTMPDPQNFYLTIPLPTWLGASGTWDTGNMWNTEHAPNGVNTSALFGGVAGTVQVTSPVTVGGIGFIVDNFYFITGPATITLDTHPRYDGSARPARLQTTLGVHEISAPMVWNQNVIASIGPSTALNISGNVTVAPGKGLTKEGSGELGMRNLRMSSVDIQQGTVRVLPGPSAALPDRVSKVTTLSIAGGPSAPTARLDLTNNVLIVSSTGTANPAITDVRAMVTSAYAGGAWTGNGITSSSANASQFGVGYGTAQQIGATGSYLGQPVDPSDAIARFTRYGDANLDGLVNLADFNRLAANFGSTGAVWSQGDFNYDGLVNLADFNRLAANFGLQAGPDGPTPDDWSNLASAVPEPASLSLLSIGALALLRRRRRAD